MRAVITAVNLSRRYGRRWALADVSFTAAEGSVTMLAGPNGAGKSTLLRILATAIRPDRGTAAIGGFDVVTQRPDVRKLTALLSHHNYLYESLTALENLEVAADHLAIPRTGLRDLLARVTLAERANDLVSTFSAGMRKRLSFARVLLQQPRVVLLDEPYAALDPAGLDLVDDVVRALKANGTTVVVATHDVGRMGRVADLALLLEGGRLAER